jgi:preprotein translocase subunit SecD
MGGFNVFHGPTELKDKTFSGDVKVDGPLSFSTIKVKGTLIVDGPVSNSKNSEIEKLEVKGPVDLSGMKIKELDAKGPINVEESTIDKIEVDGAANLKQVKIEKIEVAGALNADSIHVEDSLEADNVVHAKNSKFKKVTVKSENSVFDNSSIEELIISEPKQENQKQTVVLSGTTNIEKDIVFKVDGGEVIVKGDKVIMKDVVGGTRKDEKDL